MQINFNDFPTLNQAEKLIEKAKDLKWPTYNPDRDTPKEFTKKVRKLYYSVFETLPSSFRLLKSKDFRPNLYRVREWDQIKNVNLFTEHSYPPPAFTNFGRCNFPNYPIFYSSDNPMVALMEVIRENEIKNTAFCVSKWGLNNNESAEIIIQHYLNQSLPEQNSFKSLNEKDKEKIKKIFATQLSQDQLQGFNEIVSFFSSQFTNDNNYHISASLTYDIFFENPKRATDVLIYPSIQSKFKGVNYALHPNFVDNMLELKRLYKIKVNNFNPEKNIAQFTFGQYADIIHNKPIWEALPENEDERIEFLKKDFKGILRK